MTRKKDDDLWFTDRLSKDEIRHLRLKRIVLDRRTRFANVVLADSAAYGRLLILDDELQSAQFDEHVYHEALMRPALACHPNPESILILGGGEGATAREALRPRGVRTVVMVDIDGELLDLCRRALPTWHRGSFDDRRVEVEVRDAADYLVAETRRFDIIAADLPTPGAGDPLRALYGAAFFRKVARRLNPGGIFVTQSGPASLADRAFHLKVEKALAQTFRHVHSYSAHVPSFGLPWGFTMAANHKLKKAT